jgi:hypothetical protein
LKSPFMFVFKFRSSAQTVYLVLRTLHFRRKTIFVSRPLFRSMSLLACRRFYRELKVHSLTLDL